MKVLLFGLAVAIALFSGQANAILRGQLAWEDEVYFTVRLHDKVNGSLICTGVIIEHEWVLTAASCAQNPVGMWAIAGSYFTHTITSTKWQRPTVDYGIVHENYVEGEYHDDIALLHVSEPYVWTEYVRPAAPPQRDAIPTGEVNLFGFGHVTIGYPTTSLTSDTRRLTVDVLDWDECRQLLPQDVVTDERMVCTQQIPRQSFCREDVGGPLVKHRGQELSELVGIAAWSYLPCGFKQYPNVYTQVSLYLDWIDEKIQKN